MAGASAEKYHGLRRQLQEKDGTGVKKTAQVSYGIVWCRMVALDQSRRSQPAAPATALQVPGGAYFHWAGGFAGISTQEALAMRKDVLNTGPINAFVDAPRPILLEILGWDVDPVCMRRWTALSEAIRMHGELRPWMDTALINVACVLWP